MPLSATTLKNDIQQILDSSLPDVGEISANTPLKERVIASYMSTIKQELCEMIANCSTDSASLYTNLLEFFKKNWERTRGSLLGYTALPAAEVTQCLYALACLAADYYNDFLIMEDELPTFGAALLFPGVDLDSYSQTDSVPLAVISSVPLWNPENEKELVTLSRWLNLPEENIKFSEEEEKELATLEALDSQLSEAIELDTIREIEGLIEKQKKGLPELTKKIEQRDDRKKERKANLERQMMLKASKEAYQSYQFWIEQGKLQEHSGYLVPDLELEDVLQKHILSEDQQYFLPLSLLLSDAYQSLTLSEQQRLMKHSPETEAYGNMLERLNCIESDQSNLLGHLTILCRQLRAYDAHEGIGTAGDAGSGAYPAIIHFFAWYRLLDEEETAKIPASLKEKIDLLYALSFDKEKNRSKDTCIGTLREQLQNAMKGFEEQLISIACQGESKIQALKAAQDELVKVKIAFAEKLEQGYQGQDNWPLTRQVLDEFSVALSINTLADLNDFMGLEAEEIKEIGYEPEGNQALAKLLNSIDELVVFIHEQPLKKLEAFLHICNPYLWEQLCKSFGDVIAIVSSLEGDKLISVFKDMYYEVDIKSRLFGLFVEEPARLGLLLESFSEDLCLQMVKEKDPLGRSILHFAVHNPESLKLLLAFYPPEQRLKAVKEKDDLGKTLLHYAALNPESLSLILALYPPEQRLKAVKEKDNLGTTLLHYAALNPESLSLILAFYLPEQRLKAVKEKDNFGKTLLHYAASNPESLSLILALYPPEQRLEALIEEDNDERTVLQAASTAESLKAIFESLPNEQSRLVVVKARAKDGSTLLHRAAKYPKSLKTILESLEEEQSRLAALKEKDNKEGTALHRAAKYPKSLKTILESLEEEQDRLEAVKVKGEYDCTLLHYAISYPESLKTIFKSLSLEQSRLAAVKERAKDGNTVLHKGASYYPKSLKIILESLQEEQSCLDAVKEKGESGSTVLHCAARNSESLEILLALYPDEQSRLATIQEKNNNDSTVLHRAANYPKSLKIILENLPKELRLEVVKTQDKEGCTTLHRAAGNPESLKIILESLPKKQRFDAVQVKNKNGSTVIHYAAFEPKSLKTILESLPIKRRSDAVKEKNREGNTVCHMPGLKANSLHVIFKSLSKSSHSPVAGSGFFDGGLDTSQKGYDANEGRRIDPK